MHTKPRSERGNSMDRILTLHPEGKCGVNIENGKYRTMRSAILRVVPQSREGVPFKQLESLVTPHLDAEAFDGSASVAWYLVTVKQDLEARGLIEKVPYARPQRVRRLSGGSS